MKEVIGGVLIFLGVLVDEPRLAQNIRRGILQLKSEINHLLGEEESYFLSSYLANPCLSLCYRIGRLYRINREKRKTKKEIKKVLRRCGVEEVDSNMGLEFER